MKKILIGILSFGFLAACNDRSSAPVETIQTPTVQIGDIQTGRIKPVGILEVNIGGDKITYSFKPLVRSGLRAQDLVTSAGAVAFSNPVSVTANTSNERLMGSTFTVTANQAFSNLTLYALNQATNTGGTALKNIKAFDGTALTSSNDANRVMPSHGFTNTAAFDPANADMQVFTAAELGALTGASSFGTPLEYGFVARRNPNGDRAFASGDSGTVTIAMRTPKLADMTTPWKFTMTFLIGDDTGFSRFARSPQQTVAEILAQANAATVGGGTKRIAVVGPSLEQDAAYTGLTANLGTFAPVKISTAPTYLQNFLNNVIISQVYGGGGNSGAVLKSDFIELFNRGQAAINLGGLSLQYFAAGNAGPGTGATINLSGTIQPGSYFLVKQADGASTTATALPTPDQIGTIGLSGTAGKVALVTGSSSIATCGTRGLCTATEAARILDFVAYNSSATNFEGAASGPATTNAQSVIRAGNGCQDSNNNATDFALNTAIVATTRNSSSPSITCP
jgi:Lamin Tail Domain